MNECFRQGLEANKVGSFETALEYFNQVILTSEANRILLRLTTAMGRQLKSMIHNLNYTMLELVFITL